MQCLQCQHENRDGRRFCAECGSPLDLSCASCAFVNEAGDKFCGGCGVSLIGAVSAFIQPGRHRTDSEPEPVRRAPEAERRQLTVMFCDLADSTRLSQQLDPEDLREVIRAYQDTAATAIQRYEGYIAQYLSDGLLVYFGWPRAHEDDASRTLHAGLGIAEAITTRLNPHLETEKGVRLAARLGIHTGAVVVGEMGRAGRHENLATGETVNIAVRLEGLAQPNTVVISATTARLVQGLFVLEDLGAQALKGVAEPVQVWRVLNPLDTPEDEGVVARASFLVGRDKEMQVLLRCWEESKARRGQVVLLSGEGGMGTSSLVEMLRAPGPRGKFATDGVPLFAVSSP